MMQLVGIGYAKLKLSLLDKIMFKVTAFIIFISIQAFCI